MLVLRVFQLPITLISIFFCDKYYLIYSAFIGFVFIFELGLFAFVRK